MIFIAIAFIIAWVAFLVSLHLYRPSLKKKMTAGFPATAAPKPVAFDVRANLVSQAEFGRVLGQFRADAVSPYRYWRAEWERTGDIEALRQMERFTEAE